MKIRRYTAGETNLVQLERARRGVMSPGQAAYLAAAPYDAVAGAAQNVAGSFAMLYEQKARAQSENDKMLAAADVAMVNTDLQLLRRQASQERWSDEEFRTRAKQTIDGFVHGVEKISPMNRSNTAFMYNNHAKTLLAETELEAFDIRTDRSKERFAAAYDRLGAARDWQGQLSMLEIAQTGEGIRLLSDEEIQQARRGVEGQIMADTLLDEYAAARKVGIENEYLESLVGRNLSDEAMAAFETRKADYDGLTQQTETQLKMAKAIAISDMMASITATTTDEEMKSAFMRLELTDYGILNSWRNERERKQKTEQVVNQEFLDPHSKADRKALNELVMGSGNTTEERVQTAIELTTERRIAPQYLDSYFSSHAYAKSNQAGFAAAGEKWIEYHNRADGIPLGVDKDVLERYEMYRTLRSGMDEQEAAATVLAHYDSLTSDRVQANRVQWAEKEYGDGTDDPATLIHERVEDLLKESGEAALAVQNPIFPDEVPLMPVQMRQFIDTLSKSTYANTADIESTANTIYRALQSSGWAVTTVNKNIKSGDIEVGPQWMQKPPQRPPERTRAELATDLQAQEYRVGGRQLKLDPETVEIYTHTIGPNGADAWRLRVNGDLVYTLDGAPALFQYAPPKQGAVLSTTGQAVDLIASVQQAEAERRKRLEQEQRDVRNALKLKATGG